MFLTSGKTVLYKFYLIFGSKIYVESIAIIYLFWWNYIVFRQSNQSVIVTLYVQIHNQVYFVLQAAGSTDTSLSCTRPRAG